MPIDPATYNSILLYLAGFGVAFLVVLWVSLIIWTARDIRSRTHDPFVAILATLVSVVLFLPGVLIYLILRPRQTLAEEFSRTLEEEALLQTIEDNPVCPRCGKHIQSAWIACPSCHSQLKKTCSSCGHVIDLTWDLCPYCGVSHSRQHNGPDHLGATDPRDEDILARRESPPDRIRL